MVATAEMILESKLHGKCRGTSISLDPSVVNKSAESEKSVDAFVPLSLRGESNTLGGDQYIGLDRFGRVVDQNWVNSSTGVSTNNLTYTYDNNSNVAAESNVLDSAYSQTFTYL